MQASLISVFRKNALKQCKRQIIKFIINLYEFYSQNVLHIKKSHYILHGFLLMSSTKKEFFIPCRNMLQHILCNRQIFRRLP